MDRRSFLGMFAAIPAAVLVVKSGATEEVIPSKTIRDSATQLGYARETVYGWVPNTTVTYTANSAPAWHYVTCHNTLTP